jgi:hypothetical protein
MDERKWRACAYGGIKQRTEQLTRMKLIMKTMYTKYEPYSLKRGEFSSRPLEYVYTMKLLVMVIVYEVMGLIRKYGSRMTPMPAPEMQNDVKRRHNSGTLMGWTEGTWNA